MRATSTPAPIRKDRQRLLASCAIAAGMAALALGGPALAQVAGTGAGVNAPGLSIPIISPPAPGAPANTTNVTTTGPQTIINWTPTDTAPVGAPIDFLPTGNTLNFSGIGQYTVLNRFISGAGAPLSRQIALNGTVNSTIQSPLGGPVVQGGNIWFYNAGGILIGGGAAINVGSLVLTANDIDTAGGLFGPGGEIRFRGAAGTSEVQIAQGATINALTTGNPGSSYVALVAPRIVQRGRVTTDGSTAYVAAEQADIRINNGLFDINVLVGAEGGDVITHTGITNGPAHQQGDVNQNRVYMVAIPKNDAVTMLVSGQVGYDDAAVAQVDPDGAVRLSAGYNIENGEVAVAPVNAVAGNITVNDVVFRSNTIAHASGAFVGQPISQLPGPFLPAVPPPQQGRILVQGDGTFIGDASATIIVNPNRSVGATGNLIVQSGGANGVPGVTTVTVDGGQLGAGGSLSIRANGAIDPVTGDSRGGTASLTVSNGGTAAAVGNLTVAANGMAERAGTGTGGNASITVTGSNLATGAASQVTGNNVAVQANGSGLDADAGPFVAPDQGGNGTGGTATISVQDGGALTAANGSVTASANGSGQIGNIQSGNGTGGTARIEIAGVNTAFTAATTTISANGIGAGSISDPIIGTILSQNGGDGRGGSATFSISGDTSTAVNPGDTNLNAAGVGGDAGGAENAAGGNAFGGTATVEATGLVTATFPSLMVNAGAESGGASSPSALTGLTGNATGGTINITADNGAVLTVNSDLMLSADGSVVFGENLGSGSGGDVTVSAEDEGAINVTGSVTINVSGGSFGSGAQSAGSGNGGTVDLLAARDGALTAARYNIDANAATANVQGANGPAQGGFVNIAATAGGQISGTDISLGNTINASAQGGVSANGSVAGGGTIQIVAEDGGIDFNATTSLLAGGTSGGALAPGGSTTGSGGVIQIQVVAGPLDASAISFDTLQGDADGLTAASIEFPPGVEQSLGDGQGGTMIIDVAGGAFAANSINVSASGYGGGVGTASGTGRGGTASYSQTGGTATVGDMAISANGFGGLAPDVAGQGLGGNATIDLLGGTLTGADVIASAVGVGGIGASGNNFDPAAVVPSGNGGEGQGGTATVTINGAVVNTSTLSAIATGNGGTGGEFTPPFDTFPEAGGDGGGGIGGTAAINVSTGTLTTNGLTVDSTGIGGEGGNAFGSSSTGAPAGVGVGGDGGIGTGGSSTINLAAGVTAAGGITSASAGIGGNGGNGYSGGNGGLGVGGLAQLIVTGFDAGALAVTVDTGAFGGSGGNGGNGNGGNGGDARGGTSRIQATGTEAKAAVGDVNFITGGSGGAGGSGGMPLGATNPIAPRGGNGGTGEGGVLEVIASSGATIALDNGAGAAVVLGSRGTGGEGASGSNAAYPAGSQGGDGGNGGGAIGGTVHLYADGGTITSSGNGVSITVDGTAGASGSGGNGTGIGAPGAGGSSNGTTGGRVILESFGTPTQPGQISFGNTTIAANGDSAGRIGIYASGGNVAMASLTAEALGTAPLTNLDTDVANSGIFVGIGGGSVTTSGAMSLTTGSSVGVYAQAGGTLAAGGDMTIQADDEVDIRHDFRTGTAPTIAAGGALSITAASSIRAQTDSLLSAATSLSINTTAANGGVNLDRIASGTSTQIGAVNVVRIGSSTSGTDLTVDSFRVEIDNATAGDDIDLSGNFLTLGTLTTDGTGPDAGLDGSNIVLNSVAATTVTHAEADNDFIATVGSFQTGLNSIITGGDIIIASPGAVDLGNSTAGGFVSVDGQSIAFNNIDAGTTVDLTATGAVPGVGTIVGGGIVAGERVTLEGRSIAIANAVQTSGPLFATSSAGNIAIGSADAAGAIGITANGDITGSYSAGGNIVLNAGGNIVASANSTGGYIDPIDVSLPPAEGFVIVDADGNATLTNSSAATMFGVRAGQAASVSNTTAGEDMLVVAGTTATVANVTAGDDLGVNAPGGITANNALTTGLGADNRTFSYGPSAAGGGNVFQVTTSAADLSNIVLTATAGDIGGANIDAFDNLTATASGTVVTTGLLRSGLATNIGGRALSLEAITAGTDIILTSTTGAIASTGALAAGHDVTIDAAGNVDVSELDAGDDITVDAVGTARIGGAYSYGTGLDNEGNGSNIGVTAGGALTFAGIAQSAGNVTLQGTSVSTQAIAAVGDVAVTSTTGDIVSNGNVGGFRVAFDAAGNIDHAAGSLLDAGFTLTLDANGDIATGAASSGDDMIFTAGGTIDSGALTSNRNILLFGGGAVNLSGDATAGLALRIEASAVELGNIAVDVNDLGITATSGGVHSTGTIDVNGPVTVAGAGAVAMTGDMNAPSFINIRGASITVGNVTGGNSIALIATDGAVNSAGIIDAGRNLFISTTGGGAFNRLIAGDDIGISGSGNVSIAFMDATGDNPDGEEIGSNVGISLSSGNLFVEHGEAADDYVVNATSFRTGLNSIIAGGNIDIATAGASDLGNSTAGGSITVDAQSIAFNALDAGSTIGLTANGTAAGAEGIAGGTVIAGSDIAMNGNSIAITDSVTGAANFFASSSGGGVAVADADVAGTISIFANGNLTGTYVAGGDIFLDSAANISASATANGNLFADAAGNATLTNSGAARMFGVNAGRAAAVTTATAGEDLLVVVGTTANLTGVTAGDDVNVRANGAITAQNVRTTGTGPDTRMLGYSAAAGFTIGSGEGTSGTDGADIVMASANGAINAGALSAGDDILLNAATALTLNGAATLGLGTTGGDSSIRTQSQSAALGNLDAASDIVVGASAAVAVNTPSTAGRDIIIDAASANIASLTNPAGDPVDTLVAGRDLSIETAGPIAGGAMRAGRDLTLSAGSTIDIARAATGAGGSLSLDAAAGITAAALDGGGATSLTSSDGAILVGNLVSAGPVSAIGDSIAIDGSGNLIFTRLQANAGDARVTAGGNLAITTGTVAGEAELTAGGNMAVTQLDAANATLASNGTMALGSLTADDTLAATAQSVLTVNGAVTGRTMSVASADLVIGSAGRIGTAGTTEALEIRNIDDRAQTFVGGTGTQNGYHIDSDELTRVYGSNIRILAPAVDRSGGRFIGTVPPDVVIDDFIMTAGSANSNLGTNGSLTIETPGTARVIGAVALTGMGDANALTILADQSLEVIMGEGSIRLSGTSDATPGGMLNLVSEDVIVATLAAIDDVAAATTTDAINDRLAQNDGVTSNDGALFAGGIEVGVSGGFYVQNSGTGTRFADRRGLTFGALGLNVNTAGLDTRIVINGVHLGPAGAVTGLNTIPLLTINGTASGQAPADAFDQRSTVNGCLIVASGACSIQELETSFPVQDVIEEEVDGDDDGDGNTLPQPLITMRDLDPLTGEPLLDDPVTGAGNDDLWTPPSE